MGLRGEHCMRCGKKCTRKLKDNEETKQKQLVFECPAGHGVQGMHNLADLKPEQLTLEEREETEADRVDDVAEAVDHGPGSHN